MSPATKTKAVESPLVWLCPRVSWALRVGFSAQRSKVKVGQMRSSLFSTRSIWRSLGLILRLEHNQFRRVRTETNQGGRFRAGQGQKRIIANLPKLTAV